MVEDVTLCAPTDEHLGFSGHFLLEVRIQLGTYSKRVGRIGVFELARRASGLAIGGSLC